MSFPFRLLLACAALLVPAVAATTAPVVFVATDPAGDIESVFWGVHVPREVCNDEALDIVRVEAAIGQDAIDARFEPIDARAQGHCFGEPFSKVNRRHATFGLLLEPIPGEPERVQMVNHYADDGMRSCLVVRWRDTWGESCSPSPLGDDPRDTRIPLRGTIRTQYDMRSFDLAGRDAVLEVLTYEEGFARIGIDISIYEEDAASLGPFRI